MNLDFTLEKFSGLCETVKDNYRTITVAEYFSKRNLPEKFCIMRHDVDRMQKNALNIARIERRLGINATYYFRANDCDYSIMREIEKMGHEVGYHYEVLITTKGDYEKAIILFEEELNKFRNICDIKTICKHGVPISRYRNVDLWEVYDFKNFGISGDAHLSVDKKINYFSDTGRTWKKRILQESKTDKNDEKKLGNTDNLIELIESNKVDNIYILTHPERWTQNTIEWIIGYIKDFTFNAGKSVFNSR